MSSKLRGERVSLRPFGPEDLERTRRWMADPEVRRYLLPATPLLPFSYEEWVNRVYTSPTSQHFAITLNASGQHIGNCSLHSISWEERSAEVGIVIGEKDLWGRGYGPEALCLLLNYGFEGLGLRRILLHVYRENHRAIRAYEKVGFLRVPETWAQRLLHPFGGIVTMAVEAAAWRGAKSAVVPRPGGV